MAWSTPHVLLNIPHWAPDVKQTDQPERYIYAKVLSVGSICYYVSLYVFGSEGIENLEMYELWKQAEKNIQKKLHTAFLFFGSKRDSSWWLCLYRCIVFCSEAVL